MSNISREQFDNKDNAIIINGIEYAVPARTQAIQDKLKKIRATKDLEEYAEYVKIVETVLSAKDAKAIFSKGKEENLDYMATVVVALLKVYNASKTELDDERLAELIEKAEPIVKLADVVANK